MCLWRSCVVCVRPHQAPASDLLRAMVMWYKRESVCDRVPNTSKLCCRPSFYSASSAAQHLCRWGGQWRVYPTAGAPLLRPTVSACRLPMLLSPIGAAIATGLRQYCMALAFAAWCVSRSIACAHNTSAGYLSPRSAFVSQVATSAASSCAGVMAALLPKAEHGDEMAADMEMWRAVFPEGPKMDNQERCKHEGAEDDGDDAQEAQSFGVVAAEIKHDGGDCGDGADGALAETPVVKMGPLRCAICRMEEGDLDLGESNPATGATTPFKHFGKQARQATMCDHCAGTLRYLSPEGAVRSVAVALASDEVKNKAAFLDKLACVLALKSAPDESISRVTKVSSDKHLAFLQRHSSILSKLREKQGVDIKQEVSVSLPNSAAASGLQNAMGLQDYIRDHGNPLTNGDMLFALPVNGAVELAVRTSRSVPLGRFDLEGLVREAAEGWSDPMLEHLAALKIDDLSQSPFLRCLVQEFVSNRRLQQQLRASLVRPVTGGSTDEGGAESLSYAVSATACSSSGLSVGQAGLTALVLATPKPKRCRSEASCASSPQLATPRERRGTDSDPSGLVGGTPGAESPAMPAAIGDGAFTPDRIRVGAPPPPGPDGTPPDLNIKVTRDVPKPVLAFRKRLLDFLKLFTLADWTSYIRGKERAVVNLIATMPVVAEKCRLCQREDAAEQVMGWIPVGQAAQQLIGESKRTSRFDRVSEAKVWQSICILTSFMNACDKVKVNPQEARLVVAAGLQRLQARLVLEGVGLGIQSHRFVIGTG